VDGGRGEGRRFQGRFLSQALVNCGGGERASPEGGGGGVQKAPRRREQRVRRGHQAAGGGRSPPPHGGGYRNKKNRKSFFPLSRGGGMGGLSGAGFAQWNGSSLWLSSFPLPVLSAPRGEIFSPFVGLGSGVGGPPGGGAGHGGVGWVEGPTGGREGAGVGYRDRGGDAHGGGVQGERKPSGGAGGQSREGGGGFAIGRPRLNREGCAADFCFFLARSKRNVPPDRRHPRWPKTPGPGRASGVARRGGTLRVCAEGQFLNGEIKKKPSQSQQEA